MTVVNPCARRGPCRLDLIPSKISQRDFMRNLIALHGGDEEAICRAYAEAERDGRVVRKRNGEGYSAERYAALLLREARRNGWGGS